MSRQPDYIHMQNLIMAEIDRISDLRGRDQMSDEDARGAYAEMIAFLERMYCSSIMAVVGGLLKASTYTEPGSEDRREFILASRTMIETAPTEVDKRLREALTKMVILLELPDPFMVKTHNEQVVADVMDEMGEQLSKDLGESSG